MLQNGTLGGVLLQTAGVAAGAGAAVWFYDGMAELSRISVGSGVELAVDKDSYADSGVDADPDEIWGVIVEGVLSDDREVGFIFQIDRDTEFLFQYLTEGEVFVGGVGGKGYLIFVYGSVDAEADAYYAVGGGV